MATEQHNGIGGLLAITIVIVIITGLFVGTISYIDGYEEGIRDAHREAVKAGLAEWVPDEAGRPVFQWKESE